MAIHNEDKTFLGTEPVGRLMVRLAIPNVVAQLINMLYNIVDRIYIGHIPGSGTAALTGIGVCLPIILVISAFAALLGSGGAPRATIFMGKGDYESAEKTLGNCFAALVTISVVLTVLLVHFNRDFLLAFGASENTIDYATAYMDIYALGTLFVQLTLGMNMFITGQGFAKIGMLSVLLGAVSNIILDPIFIFVLGMGIRGAALATIISQCFSCIWVLVFLTGRRTLLRIKWKYLRPERAILLPCLALGAASFIMQASESIISMCFNASLLKYGGDIAVGAMTILTSCMQFAMLPLQGVGQGAQPVISYAFGAGRPDRMREAFFNLLKMALCYAGVLWLLMMSFPGVFAAIFTSDAELIAFAKTALRVYMAMAVLFGIQISCQFTFTSLGRAAESILVAVTRKFILLIPLIYFLPRVLTDNQAIAVYMAEPVADFIAVTFTSILFYVRFRQILAKCAARQERV